MGRQGAPQRTGPPEAGEDQGATTGQLLMELGCRRQPVDAGEIDVDHRHVRFGRESRRHDRVTPVHGGDHVKIGLQLEQRHQRAPDHVNILGEEDSHRQHHYPRSDDV